MAYPATAHRRSRSCGSIRTIQTLNIKVSAVKISLPAKKTFSTVKASYLYSPGDVASQSKGYFVRKLLIGVIFLFHTCDFILTRLAISKARRHHFTAFSMVTAQSTSAQCLILMTLECLQRHSSGIYARMRVYSLSATHLEGAPNPSRMLRTLRALAKPSTLVFLIMSNALSSVAIEW